MSADISITVYDERWKASLKPYTKTVRAACEAVLGRKRCEIAVVLADDKFIRELNSQYRGKNKPTNVLSFEGDDEHLGDIILAYETIEKEAKQQNKKFRDHAAHLLVHGTLHLLGHDHETDDEAEKMEKQEIKTLKKLGVSNPYL
ncbi:MAG: rRNA maturation RNase YbeY [Rickettsiales bacterium]